MVAPARRVALLGGGFSTDEDGLLDDRLLSHVGRPRPKVCFVPTASGDAPAYIDQFSSAFEPRSCEPSVLSLFRRELDDEALRRFLLDQDVVYVGGGNTANLLAVWRAHGVDRMLSEACNRGTLLCGISVRRQLLGLRLAHGLFRTADLPPGRAGRASAAMPGAR